MESNLMESDLYTHTLSLNDEAKYTLTNSTYSDIIRVLDYVKPATAEENVELFRRIKDGDTSAQEEMFLKNLGLITTVIKKFNMSALHSFKREDLLNEGVLGLSRAIEKYNPEQGAFSTYAEYWIKSSISYAVKLKDSTVKRPMHFQEAKEDYRTLEASYREAGIPLPDDDTIIKVLNISKDVLHAIRNDHLLDTVSTSTLVSSDEDGSELQDFLSYEEDNYAKIEDSMSDKILYAFLKLELSKVDYYIVYHRRLATPTMTTTEIGKELGITHQRVIQLESKALKKLKKYVENASFSASVSSDVKKLINRNLFKLAPLSPRDITKYLFLRDNLTLTEKAIYREMCLGDIEYTTRAMAIKLNVAEGDIKEAEISLLSKEDNFLNSNEGAYEQFHSALMGKYKSGIYKVNLEMDLSEFMDAYSRITAIWNGKTVLDVERSLAAKGMSIDSNMREKVAEFLGEITPKEIPKGSLEKKINALLNSIYDRREPLEKELYEKYRENKDAFSTSEKTALEYRFGKISKEEVLAIDPHFDFDSVDRLYERLALLYFGIEDYKKISSARSKHNTDDFDGVDLELYRAYLQKNGFDFEGITKMIFDSFFLEHKDIAAIAKILNVKPSYVKKRIIEGLYRMDYYRFGILKRSPFSREELLFAVDKMKQSDVIKMALREYIATEDAESVASKYGLEEDTIYRQVHNLNNACLRMRTSTVVLDEEDIRKAVEDREALNILTLNERIVLACRYGFKNEYNEEGIKLSHQEIASKYGMTLNAPTQFKRSACEKIKARKIGLYRSQLDFIDPTELASVLNFADLPLSPEEIDILKKVYSIDGEKAHSLKEVSELYDMSVKTVRTQILNAVVKIRRFQNRLAKLKSDFPTASLAYFSKRDRQILIDFFKNDIALEELHKKYSIPQKEVQKLIAIYENADDFNLLDFEYFYSINSVINDDDIPFYGDKHLALELFDLYYEKSLSFKEIVRTYHPELTAAEIESYINNLIIATEKRRLGIKKTCDFDRATIRDYYLANQKDMSNAHRREYFDYFSQNRDNRVSTTYPLSGAISIDLLSTQDGYRSLAEFSRDEIEAIIRRYKDKFSHAEVHALEDLYSIPPRNLMSGSDLNRVLRLLSKLEYVPEKTLTLK